MTAKIHRTFKFITVLLLPLFFLFTSPSVTPVYAFRFMAWGDTKSGLSTLQSESIQAKVLNPLFSIYTGDLIETGSTTSLLDTWKNSLNGGISNGMFDITFPVRGNHDNGTSAIWPGYFDLRGNASRISAVNYSELNPDTTYSFDYDNSHFVGIDVLGDASVMSAAQITWLDNDLTAAENRGIVHTFLFWHGPIYPLAEHCCPSPNPSLIPVLNKHPSISASFHGHEHVVAYTHINSLRVPGITHEFEEFVSGDAGAGPDTCVADRFDYCMTNETRKHGFVTIDVSGNTFVVNTYALGTSAPVKTMTFSKAIMSSPTPTPIPISTPTITPTSIPTKTPTSTPIPTPTVTPISSPTSNFQPSSPYHATFYYPWYKNQTVDNQWSYWTDSGNTPPNTWFSHFLPDIDPNSFNPIAELYSTNDYNTFKWQVSNMAKAKIEVSISSWWGQGTKEDVSLNKIISNFMPMPDNPYPNLRWSIYYEDEGFGDPNVDTIVGDLTYIKNNFTLSPYYLKINGKPVIFVYAGAGDTPGTMTQRWSQANQQLGQAFYVVLKVFSNYSADPNQPNSWHQYAPANRSGIHFPYSVYASPGFWLDDGSTPRLVRDLSAFDTAITSLINANVTWKLIETWNEWGEGSSVEPGNQVRLNTTTNKEELDPTAPIFGTSFIDLLNSRLPNLEAGTGSNQTPSPNPSPSSVPTASPTSSPIPGDANGDNLVNEMDYTVWLSHFGQTVSGVTNGDFNSDGRVDGIDYTIWINYYGG